MAAKDILVNVLESRGWMGIRSIYFDNHWFLKIRTTEGFVAYSKTHECFFVLPPNDPQGDNIFPIRNNIVFDNRPHFQMLKDFASIRTSEIIHMQRFEIETLTVSNDISGKTFGTDVIPNYKTNIDTPTIKEAKLMAVVAPADPTKDKPTFEETEYEQFIELTENKLYLRKSFADKFMKNQLEFKKWIITNLGSELGVTIDDLI